VANDLETKLGEAIDDVSDRAAALKDAHLLEAAMVTGKRIVSHDETARRVFRAASRVVPRLRDIVWLDPANETEQVEDWLRDGAPEDKHRRLGAM